MTKITYKPWIQKNSVSNLQKSVKNLTQKWEDWTQKLPHKHDGQWSMRVTRHYMVIDKSFKPYPNFSGLHWVTLVQIWEVEDKNVFMLHLILMSENAYTSECTVGMWRVKYFGSFVLQTHLKDTNENVTTCAKLSHEFSVWSNLSMYF